MDLLATCNLALVENNSQHIDGIYVTAENSNIIMQLSHIVVCIGFCWNDN
jgi:hypothetical protein